MKKLFTLLAITLFAYNVFAQAPHRLSYQAVIRNSTGDLVTNHAVGMKISILQGSASGTPVYVETQTPTTNGNGLATIEIGGGTLVSGNFNAISWGSGTYFLKTETDPAGGISYSIAGTSQLLSVPYALFAKTGGGLSLPFFGSVSSSESVGFKVENYLGNAIEGYAAAKSGSNSGITGKSDSGDGAGVSGINNAHSGEAIGVNGYSHSTAGYGVNGFSPEGIGVRGEGRIGIIGRSYSNNYYAIVGEFLSETNSGTGILATTKSPSGFGLQAIAYSASGSTYGIHSETKSTTGTGVYGYASTSSGLNYGIYGRSESGDGYGVYGSSNGVGIFGEGKIGIKGKAIPGGYSGYFTGRFCVLGNIGFGDDDPDCKLVVKAPNTDSQHMIDVRNPSGYPLVRMRQNSNGSGAIAIYPVNSTAANIWLYGDGNSYIKGGNLGVGTETPLYKVDVSGSIRALGSVYYGGSEGSANGTAYTKPDYVFEESYKVFGTEEVEEFLEKENHLPWITSAEKEREENGNATDMTRMAFETVETVENLQLQIIEQSKLIRELEARLRKLEAKGRR